jgi:hypothetical protein
MIQNYIRLHKLFQTSSEQKSILYFVDKEDPFHSDENNLDASDMVTFNVCTSDGFLYNTASLDGVEPVYRVVGDTVEKEHFDFASADLSAHFIVHNVYNEPANFYVNEAIYGSAYALNGIVVRIYNILFRSNGLLSSVNPYSYNSGQGFCISVLRNWYPMPDVLDGSMSVGADADDYRKVLVIRVVQPSGPCTSHPIDGWIYIPFPEGGDSPIFVNQDEYNQLFDIQLSNLQNVQNSAEDVEYIFDDNEEEHPDDLTVQEKITKALQVSDKNMQPDINKSIMKKAELDINKHKEQYDFVEAFIKSKFAEQHDSVFSALLQKHSVLKLSQMIVSGEILNMINSDPHIQNPRVQLNNVCDARPICKYYTVKYSAFDSDGQETIKAFNYPYANIPEGFSFCSSPQLAKGNEPVHCRYTLSKQYSCFSYEPSVRLIRKVESVHAPSSSFVAEAFTDSKLNTTLFIRNSSNQEISNSVSIPKNVSEKQIQDVADDLLVQTLSVYSDGSFKEVNVESSFDSDQISEGKKYINSIA